MKKLTKVFIGVAALAVLMMAMTVSSFAGTANDKASVSLSAGMPGQFDLLGYPIDATGDLFEKYYPELKDLDTVKGVSFADALVGAHIEKYGADKVTEKLGFASSSLYGLAVTKQFGHTIVGMYYVNNVSIPTNVGEAAVKDEDYLYVHSYSDDSYSDFYSYFDTLSIDTTVGTEVTLKLTADDWGKAVTPENVSFLKVNLGDGKTSAIKNATYTYENGTIKAKFKKAAVYVVTASGTAKGQYSEGKIGGALAIIDVADKKPAKPVIKSAKRTAKRTAKVTWKKAKNAKKYRIAWRAKGAKKWRSKLVTKTTYTLKKLNAKKAYQVKVRSYNGKQKSAYSKVKTIKVKK